MEIGDLGFLCDRKPSCSKSTFKLFEQRYDIEDIRFEKKNAQLKRKRKLINGVQNSSPLTMQ